MRTKNLYLFPVIVFSVDLVKRVGILLLAESYSRAHAYKPVAIRGLINGWTVAWSLLVVAEIIVYCLIRKRLYERTWVLTHTWCSLVAFLVLPVVSFFISNLIFAKRHPGDKSMVAIRTLFSIETAFFWVLFITGHLFFIFTIAKSFDKKSIMKNDTAGLLDEFLG